MIVISFFVFYASRVILDSLGETDFGLYNVVGSIAVSLVFIQNALTSSTQRYLSVEIGKENQIETNKVFSVSLHIHIIIALWSFGGLELVGLILVNNVLNIPSDRLFAANVVLQFSILSYCLNMLRIPYNAVIIAFEKMTIFAVLGFMEALLKLLIAFSLIYTSGDKLIVYAGLVLFGTIAVNFLYILYCTNTYKNVCQYNYEKRISHDLQKDMMHFLSWNMLGGISSIAVNECPGYFMNVYVGIHLNAALGIAKQLSSGVNQLLGGFQTAFNPQIVKLYAAKMSDELYKLVCLSTQVSYYLMFVVIMPLVLCINEFLHFWLVDVPLFTPTFCIFIMIAQMVSAISSPLWMLAHAVGNIRNYQIVLCSMNLCVIPISIFVLKCNYEPYLIFLFQVIVNGAVCIYRSFYLKRKMNFPAEQYLFFVMKKCICLSLISIPLPFVIRVYREGLVYSLCSAMILFVSSCVVFFFWGIDKFQREKIVKLVKNKLRPSNS